METFAKRLMTHLWASWEKLPDVRAANNNRQYEVADAVMGSFAMFYLQEPSFDEWQRRMKSKRGRCNAETLFGMKEIPSTGQIRNLLDDQPMDGFTESYDWLLEQLKASGEYAEYRDVKDTWLIALDGVTYFSSAKVKCEHCLRRKDSQGGIQYTHSAIVPVIVKPGRKEVLGLPPEFVTNQDGQVKQDCELNASKRWLTKHSQRFAAKTATFLGDDLYAHQPFCAWIAETLQQYFMCVAKPDSHVWLYESLECLAKVQGIETHEEEIWTGKRFEIWTYRWVSQVALTGTPDAYKVNWLELIVTSKKSGDRLFFNTWVTNHTLEKASLRALAQAGRARWKVENESHNILKEHGYHLEHNFGHGDHNLSAVLFSLNVLSFVAHTVQQLIDHAYKLLRKALVTRRTLFETLRTAVNWIVFPSWRDLWLFLLDSRDIPLPTELRFSD